MQKELIKTNKSADGTSYQTEVKATYADLVALLGMPHINGSADGKIRAEWRYELGLGKWIVTLYDYKDGNDIRNVTDWHIGAKQKAIAELFKMYIEQTIANHYSKYNK